MVWVPPGEKCGPWESRHKARHRKEAPLPPAAPLPLENKQEAFQTSVNTTARQRAQAETTENHRNLHSGSSAPMKPPEWVAGL